MRGEDEERDVVCSHVHEAHIRKKKKEREFLLIIIMYHVSWKREAFWKKDCKLRTINSKMLSAKMNVNGKEIK